MFLLQPLVSLAIVCISFTSASPIQSTNVLKRTSVGCGITHPIAGIGITTYHEVKSGNRTRSYSIHLPSNYDKTHEYPVVVGFHGSSSIGLFFEVDTGLSSAKYSSNVSSC
jgi:poly(3-hydroxybutyrate) depolymerase